MIDYSVMFNKVRFSREDGSYAIQRKRLTDYEYLHSHTVFKDVVGPTLLVRWQE